MLIEEPFLAAHHTSSMLRSQQIEGSGCLDSLGKCLIRLTTQSRGLRFRACRV